jgi:hypothetical protein
MQQTIATTLVPSHHQAPLPELQFVVEHNRSRKQASARLRGTQAIIGVPAHWPMALREQAITELKGRMQQLFQRQQHSLNRYKEAQENDDPLHQQPHLTLRTLEDVQRFVNILNKETFNVPLADIKVGWAKYSRLAQVNLRTRTMTISKYCLGEDIPLHAFRYLIIHELAHFHEANHSPRFWAHVAKYCPDYSTQRHIMRHYFQRNVAQRGDT